MLSIALIFVPTILLFSLFCYLVDKVHLAERIGPRHFVPIMSWVAFSIWVGHCLVLSIWAASSLRVNFRTVVTSRFQPQSLIKWWRPTRRKLLRTGITIVSAAALFLIVLLVFYAYQNWRSSRAWTAFQKEIKKRHESLALSPLLPTAVPANQNLAMSQSFKSWIKSTNTSFKHLYEDLKRFDTTVELSMGGASGNVQGVEWITQSFAPLDDYVKYIAPENKLSEAAAPREIADAILQGLKSFEPELRELSSAARLPYFQTSTNRNAAAVLNSDRHENSALLRLHMLFQIRACARLAVSQTGEAAEDLLTGLSLANLSRQIPDVADDRYKPVSDDWLWTFPTNAPPAKVR